jgi:hypothetical protein
MQTDLTIWSRARGGLDMRADRERHLIVNAVARKFVTLPMSDPIPAQKKSL